MPFDGRDEQARWNLSMPPPRQRADPTGDQGWWGRDVRTPDGRVGRSESNPDPAGPHFLVFVRFDADHGEWFRQSVLTLLP